jgi:hypothetical protein
MKFTFPKIKDGIVTSLKLTPAGSIKYIAIECYADEIDLSGLNLDNNAEVSLNRIIKWISDTPQ